MAGLGSTCSRAASHPVEVALAATAHRIVSVQSIIIPSAYLRKLFLFQVTVLQPIGHNYNHVMFYLTETPETS